MVAYSFKGRFVEPIRVGLGLAPRLGPGLTASRSKMQTIRAAGLRRHARPGDVLQLYTGMRTKKCQKIGDARCTGVEMITIEVRLGGLPLVIKINGRRIAVAALDDFARSDGFTDAEDMRRFWAQEHGAGTFVGYLITWERLDGK